MLQRCITILLIGLTAFPIHGYADIKICWETELKPPYLQLGDSGRVEGIMVRRLENILEKAGIPYQHTLLPWTRCLQAIEQGEVDLVPNASFKPQRAEYAYYSSPAYASELVLYYSEDRFKTPPHISDVETLARYTVGGIQGFNYSFYKDQVTIKPKVKRRAQLVDMLMRKRIDFAVMQRNVVEEMVKRKEFSIRGINYIPDPVKPRKEYHILVSKKSTMADKLLKAINKGLDATRNRLITTQ